MNYQKNSIPELSRGDGVPRDIYRIDHTTGLANKRNIIVSKKQELALVHGANPSLTAPHLTKNEVLYIVKGIYSKDW